jgi:hypothetical protein
MQKFPVFRQIAWYSIISQGILLLGFIGIAGYFGRFSLISLFVGALIYILYYAMIKYSLENTINRGLKLINTGEFNQAIIQFEATYEFYSRHSWIDQWRFLFLHSSTLSYREMALVNIAVCYSQIGDGKKCKQYYQRTLTEFPQNMMAQVALKAIQSFESNQT